MRIKGAAIAATGALALALAACGGGDGGSETTETVPAPPVNVTPPGKRVARFDRIAKVGAPTYIAQPDGNTNLLFITNKPGYVYVVRKGKLIQEPFLDLKDEVNATGSEQGLFSIEFAPDYAQSGLFYVSYTLDDNSVQVDEFKRSTESPLLADPESRRPIINARHGSGGRDQHNGGQLEFGPDGKLWISFGEGGPVIKEFVSNRAQQRSVLLGKIIRIDPSESTGELPYKVPPDNPFVGEGGIRPEIFLYGLRNPWRFSFDAKSGDMLIADPGATDVEEVNFVRSGTLAGANFGWPRFEGNRPFRRDYELLGPGELTKPIHTYAHDKGCSIIGGYVIRDPRLPSLDGRYVYSDACSGDVRTFVPTVDGAKDDRSLGLRLSPTTRFGVVSFGEGSDKRIYAASFSGGVYALNPEPKSTKKAK